MHTTVGVKFWPWSWGYGLKVIFANFLSDERNTLRCLRPLGGGLVASGWAYQLRILCSNPGTCWSLFFGNTALIPVRSPTYCHNTILDWTAKLDARGASAGSRRPSIWNEASLKESNSCYYRAKANHTRPQLSPPVARVKDKKNNTKYYWGGQMECISTC